MEQQWYAYGIIDRADAVRIDPPAGIDGAPTVIVPAGDLAAVAVHLHSEGFRRPAEAVKAHDLIIQDIFSRVPIMPLRFGTRFPSRETMEALLIHDGARWRSRFEAIRDAAQWRMRLLADDDGATWLARLRAAADEVHTRLAAHAVDGQSDVFLVRRDNEYSFVHAADEMTVRCRENGIRLEIHGPHPAYHFASHFASPR